MKIEQPFRRVPISATFVARVGAKPGLDGNKRHRGPDGLCDGPGPSARCRLLGRTARQHHRPRGADRPGRRPQRPRSGVVRPGALPAGDRVDCHSVWYQACGRHRRVGCGGLRLSFTPPLYSFNISDPQNVIALGIFLTAALVVGNLAARMRQAARDSARLYETQSALLRVATRAAQSNPPAPVVDVVCRELGPLCRADLAELSGSRHGWSPRRTRCGGASAATCMTESSNGSSRSGSNCAWLATRCPRNCQRCTQTCGS